jgi:hypothetical protein
MLCRKMGIVVFCSAHPHWPEATRNSSSLVGVQSSVSRLTLLTVAGLLPLSVAVSWAGRVDDRGTVSFI